MAHLVAAGALVDTRGVLLAHRTPARLYYPDCWDLPGGHIEPGEEARAALARELHEELGIRATITGEPSLHLSDHPDRPDGADLRIWVIREWVGEPRNVAEDEHDDLRWVGAEDLPGLGLAHQAYAGFLRDVLT